MKYLSCILCLAAMLAVRVTSATDATWVNNGTIVIPPNIDATNVINNGVMGPFVTSSMFDTSNTRNFTNAGSMSGGPGFRFDNAPRNSSGQLIGLRKPAANFHNRISGDIAGLVTTTIVGFFSSQLFIQATNVINQGMITVGADGLLSVSGTNVNLSRGGIGVLSVDDSAQIASANDSPAQGQFYPAAGITDNYWAQTNMTFAVDSLISPFGFIQTPTHTVQAVAAGGGYVNQNVSILLTDYYYEAVSNVMGNSLTIVTATNMDGTITNYTLFTNELRQAAFVQLRPNDTTTGVGIEFLPTDPRTLPTNDYFSAAITLYMPTTNVLTGQQTYSVVYLQDTLAGGQDRGILPNYLTTLGGLGVTQTRRPRSYLLSRAVQGFGATFGVVIGNDFFYPPGSLTNRVTDAFAAYSGKLDNILYRPPPIPAGTATNFSGRTEIFSDSLDVSRARVRGEGLVTLQTRHLVNSSNAAVDCENLSLMLGSTNGLLTIRDLTKTTVDRVQGDVRAWSAQWSNAYRVIIDSYDVSTNPAVLVPITNIIGVQNHIMVYDTSQLSNTVPALVQQFQAVATNIVMEDRANIVLEMQIKGQSFTLNGEMYTSGGVPDWRYTNAPGLRYLTNNGILSIANEAHFGDDGPVPYLAFVNHGLIQSQGQDVLSAYVDLGGTNRSASSLSVTTADGKVENGRILTGGDVSFWAGGLKLNQAFINSTGRVYFSVTNALFDNGPASANSIACRDGFYQAVKANTGDLLGTSFRTIAPNFALVNNVWAGRDDGVSKSGFVNNGAMGILTLAADGFDPFFVFGGANAQNGLYTDMIDLSLLSDYANQMQINSNLVIYYAAAKLNFAPPGGLTPEEYLDNQFGGRLRWVQQFAGPNSSVDVVINGNQTVKVNKALRNSRIIDSDADGIPNFFDASPFDGVIIQSAIRTVSPSSIQISWNAAPNLAYRVEYKNLNSPEWKLLQTTNNTSGVVTKMTITDTTPDATRYYRVSYNPNGL